ncbi:MAG: hypothetical protein PSX81_10045, partial [bacterium]|nr:hypothetical protein [bacterium]
SMQISYFKLFSPQVLNLILNVKSQTPVLIPTVGPWLPNAQTQTLNNAIVGGVPPVSLAPSDPNPKFEVKYRPCSDEQEGVIITSLNCAVSNYMNPFANNYKLVSDPVLLQWGQEGGPPPPPLPPSPSLSLLTCFPFTSSIVPFVTANQRPMFWVREAAEIAGGTTTFNTRFIIAPNGNTGINTNNPRGTFEVVQIYGGYNDGATAIFGKTKEGTTTPLLGEGGISAGTNGFRTKQIMIFNSLQTGAYNRIIQDRDQAILFTDGAKVNGSNENGSLVIAPWATDYNLPSSLIGGLRMDKLGNVEIHGTLRSTKLTVNTKWWPDFVFSKTYNLRPLNEVKSYIAQFGHLPGMPSQDSVTTNGQNIGEIQRLQQLKIEELTLYIIQQNDLLKIQKEAIEAQEARLLVIENSLKNKTK